MGISLGKVARGRPEMPCFIGENARNVSGDEHSIFRLRGACAKYGVGFMILAVFVL